MTVEDHSKTAEQQMASISPLTPVISKSRLPLKDAVTVSLSIAALAVSLSTLYVSQFRVITRLQARLADFEAYPTGEIIARFTISNSGNQPAIILGAHYMLSEHDERTIRPWGGPANPFNPADGIERNFPMLFQPRELRLIELPVPARKLVDAFRPAPSNGKPWNVFLSFHFVSLDVKGEAYDILTQSLARIEVSENGLRSITELQSPPYTPINLLAIRTSVMFTDAFRRNNTR